MNEDEAASPVSDDMRADYSDILNEVVAKGVRGKYVGKLSRRALLAPDVAKAFPTDDEVNNALRRLMAQEKPSLVETA